MSALILELKQGESMILNGAVIRFKTRTRLELSTQARFLFGKQIMLEEDAKTPAQQIYYAIQQAYILDDCARPEALIRARDLVNSHPQSPATKAILAALATSAGFDALKLARQMMREEAVPAV